MSHMGKGRDREPGRKGLPCLRKPTIRKVKSIVSGGRVEDGRGSLGPMANAPFSIPPGHRRRSPAPGSHRTWRADFPHQRCSSNIEMTPLCKVDVTLPRILGSRGMRRGGGVDEQAGVQPA